MPTAIEWCDETFNPWWGCERVSPACAHCYADTLARRRAPGQELWGAGHAFRFMSEGTWKLPLRWARRLPAKLGRRPRVFCASMADVFEDRDELLEPRKRLIDLVYATPELDWLLLTKRPENVGRMLGPAGVGLYAVDDRPVPFPQPNIWVGVSIENARFTWRADVLRQVPAAIRFISAEPLLGSLLEDPPERAAGARGAVTPRQALIGAENGPDGDVTACLDVPSGDTPRGRKRLDLTGIDWVIVGGESGPKSRRTKLEWIIEIVEACESSGVAPFVKQLGRELGRDYQAGTKGQEIAAYPPEIRVRDFPRSAAAVAA